MFAGIYEVISSKEVKDRIRYETKLLDKFEDLIGRLIIGYDKEFRQSYPHLKKMFSHSTTHQFLSAITRCEDFERVVISEPLTIVPYALEGQHPDYNVPTEDLTIQDEVAFTIRLGNWLNIVKRKQPKRKYIYYIGGTHHYFVLKQTLEKARKPFKL